ncbi:MAG: hypothetical protein R2795_11630 [Saprospiraceae bacterium]
MGVIIRQSVKTTLLNYAGIIIGAVNTIILYPLVLEPEAFGLMQNLLGKASLLSNVLLFGTGTSVIRFFPTFENKENRHNGLLALLLLFPLIMACLLASVFWLWGEEVALLLQFTPNELLQNYAWLVLPLSLLMAWNMLLFYFPKNFLRTAVPAFFEQVVVKLASLGIAVAYFWQWITMTVFFNSLLIVFAVPTLSLMGYIHHQGHFTWRINWSFLKTDGAKGLLGFSFVYWLGSIAAASRTYIAPAFLADMVGDGGLVLQAAFAPAFYIATAIAIPGKSIDAILSAFTARYVKEEDWLPLGVLYKKAANHQFLLGVLLLVPLTLACTTCSVSCPMAINMPLDIPPPSSWGRLAS